MRTWISDRFHGLALMLVTASTAIPLGGCDGRPLTTFERLAEARRLTGSIQVEFTRAADAGNRAVMADTDDAAAAFARESEAAADTVDKQRGALQILLHELSYAEETRLLDEFAVRLADYRSLERSILELAVENTNVKAQRLSFGPAREASRALGDSLRRVTEASRGDVWRVRALANEALAEARQIQVLQAPHIAESDDVAMSALESEVDDAVRKARLALDGLAAVVKAPASPSLAEARTAFDRLVALNTEIIGLSRRNSDVRSLALALGQKRGRTAACEASLQALQDALARRSFAGTR